MNTGSSPRSLLYAGVVVLATLVNPSRCRAGGVTFITHGLNGNVDGWITGMATNLPHYYRFPGTNFTCYKAYFYTNSGQYFLTARRVAGSPPLALESGEIIVKFDWSQFSNGNSYDTYQIAAAAVPALLSTNFIPELGGHALAELPLHLIGHSRGGSLVCEISRMLGTNGLWVDHVTTLDPHPLNNDGFNLDILFYSDVDAPARTYANVLFHDNYFQKIDSAVNGEPVPGAYKRQLTSLSGGYSLPHSDVHLWYHGTLDWRVPASDSEASIDSTARATWWTSYEAQGVKAGFLYSLIGGGDRLSNDQPVGPGSPAIRDGYNQVWDFGAGLSSNRTALTSNSGAWPNLIRFNRTQTNQVLQGQSTPVKLFYQWARPSTSSATLSVYLDDDLNPFNGNQKLLAQVALAATGSASFIGSSTLTVPLAISNAGPGWHALLAVIKGGGQTRYLYAPEWVDVISAQPPALDIAQDSPAQIQIGVNGHAGQTIILQSSADWVSWQPLVTNALPSDRWVYTNSSVGAAQFYRAALSP